MTERLVRRGKPTGFPNASLWLAMRRGRRSLRLGLILHRNLKTVGSHNAKRSFAMRPRRPAMCRRQHTGGRTANHNLPTRTCSQLPLRTAFARRDWLFLIVGRILFPLRLISFFAKTPNPNVGAIINRPRVTPNPIRRGRRPRRPVTHQWR